jgi:nucleotide-binding universal stress UspA family protein
MFREILIVFDDQKKCPEAINYGREFALRMDACVTFLMLVPMSFRGRTLLGSKRSALKKIEQLAAKLLMQFSETFIQEGIEVSSACKVGEPSQEFLKFLADRPPFQAIIWGSSPELPAKNHWFSQVSRQMECPLLTVSKKGHP